MAKMKPEFVAFNRGIASPLMAARTDIPRRAMSASTMENWIPNALGPMSLRPGKQYINTITGTAGVKYIPFVYAADDTAAIEVTDYAIRIVESDVLLAQANTVTATVANASFTSDVASWTDADEGGTATSAWLTGGYLSLLGDGTNAAKRTQTVTITNGSVHFLAVTINRGPVTIRVGSTSGGDEYVAETQLLTGYHVFKMTATGTSAFIQLLSREEYPVLVDSIDFNRSASGTAISLTAPWPVAYRTRLRWDQVGDVVFVDCYGVRPTRIERHGIGSWSVVDSPDNKGPFRNQNLTPVTLTASALTGSITLTASAATFKSTHVGALFTATSNGQSVTQNVSAQNTFTDPILVTGIGAARAFGIVVTGTFAGTITLQRSVGAIGAWVDVTTYTTTQSTTLTDNLDNQTIYYRIGIKTGGYTSGTAVCTLNYSGGSITGIGRVTAFTSSTVVTAVVLKDFGTTSATDKWSEGAWSDYRGWPSACRFKDGRMWHVGKDKVWGSVVEDYHNHDLNYIGDAGPISRSIGSGPVDKLLWLQDNGDLIAGGAGAEYYARASSLEEPLTPTQFSIRPGTTFGSSNVDAVKIDDRVIFVDSSGSKLRELAQNGVRYEAIDLTLINPEILRPSVVAMAVQRRPDTRIHCVLSDGTVAVFVTSKAEDVNAWIKIKTASTTSALYGTTSSVKDVFVLPGTEEDSVYYAVSRTLNVGGSSTERWHLEKWALESACVGGDTNKQADSFLTYSGAPTTSLTAAHLPNETVTVWGDGVDQGTFLANSSGVITLTTAVSAAVYGLVYTANFESTKLAFSAGDLIKKKQATSLGVVLINTHVQGLKYGPDSSYLDDLPIQELETDTDSDGIWTDYNYQAFSLNGEYTVDSRLYLRATAPRPCTVAAAIVNMEVES